MQSPWFRGIRPVRLVYPEYLWSGFGDFCILGGSWIEVVLCGGRNLVYETISGSG